MDSNSRAGWYVKVRVEQDVLLMCRGTEAEVKRNPFAFVVDQHYVEGSRKVLDIGAPSRGLTDDGL